MYLSVCEVKVERTLLMTVCDSPPSRGHRGTPRTPWSLPDWTEWKPSSPAHWPRRSRQTCGSRAGSERAS